VLQFVIPGRWCPHPVRDGAATLRHEQRTAPEDVDIIRQLAVRYGDDAIAVVLTKLGRRTGKAKRWNAERVRTARSTYAIPGHARTVPDQRSSRWGGRPSTAG